VAAWAGFVAVLWIVRPRDVGLAELVRIVPYVFRLGRDIVADGGAPLGVRAAFVGLVLWLLTPVDLIPEFIPVLGPREAHGRRKGRHGTQQSRAPLSR
jgi:Protein of unknown function (DUF1232)